jgi:integrase
VTDYKSFPELAELWIGSMAHCTESTRERYAFAIENLSSHFQSLNGGLVESVEKWQRIRRKETSASTFNLELSTLRTVLAYGVAHGRPKVNPAGEVRNQRTLKKEVYVPSRADYERIVAHIAPQLCGLKASRYLRILATSGMRTAELAELKWRDVDFEADTVTIGAEGNSKNGRARTIPMFTGLRSVLEELARESTDKDGLVIGAFDLRYWMAESQRSLGLPSFRAHHSWRKYFVTQCLLAGVDAAVAGSYVGHSDNGYLIYKTYNVIGRTAVVEGAEKINAFALKNTLPVVQ